jgi:hypothetical protein
MVSFILYHLILFLILIHLQFYEIMNILNLIIIFYQYQFYIYSKILLSSLDI